MIITSPAKLSTTSRTKGMHRTSCNPTELRCLDTNRKNTDADRPVPRLECERIAAQHSAFFPQITREICGVDFGLKTYEVVMTHGRKRCFCGKYADVQALPSGLRVDVTETGVMRTRLTPSRARACPGRQTATVCR